jgi:parallel beta-helix repeat protein
MGEKGASLLRRIVFGLWLTLLFTAMLILASEIQLAEASGTIYIRADGSVEGTPNIFSEGNITYTFTENIFDEIVIERNNIVVDGAGYTLQGSGNGTGVRMGVHTGTRSNITIKNMEIESFEYGIHLVNCTGITVKNLTLANEKGIILAFTKNSTIAKNNITDNQYGIVLVMSSHNRISGNNITNNHWSGILLLGSSDFNIISGNNVSANDGGGIRLSESTYNTITWNNIMANNLGGVSLWYSDHNTIKGNTVTTHKRDIHDAGISLDTSYGNTIKGNNIINNSRGFALIGPTASQRNIIYHNNILDNDEIYIYGSHNTWNSGYPSGGNFWGNIGEDSNYDGIADTSYCIDGDRDCYPLMGVFSSFETSHIKSVNVISNSTIEDYWYFESNSTIIMHVTNMTTRQRSGFCRVCVPKDLISPNYVVTVDGVEPHYVDYLLYDNCTHRWVYFAYDQSAHTLKIVLAHILFGDLNNDEIVDMHDIGIAASTFGSHPDHPRWNPQYDLNEDSEIDLADLLLIAKNFGTP